MVAFMTSTPDSPMAMPILESVLLVVTILQGWCRFGFPIARELIESGDVVMWDSLAPLSRSWTPFKEQRDAVTAMTRPWHDPWCLLCRAAPNPRRNAQAGLPSFESLVLFLFPQAGTSSKVGNDK